MRRHPLAWRSALEGRAVACLFEQPSTRSRVSLEVAINRLGALPVMLSPAELRLDHGDTVADTARVLSSYCDAIAVRTHHHRDLLELVEHASVPAINVLTDREYPCRALADCLTLRDRFGELAGLPVAYIGDCEPVAHSLIEAAMLSGIELRIAAPPGAGPGPGAAGPRGRERPRVRDAARGGPRRRSPSTAPPGAPSCPTPTASRPSCWRGPCPRAVFMHAIPTARGREVHRAVLDGERTLTSEQAANLLPVEQAVLRDARDRRLGGLIIASGANGRLAPPTARAAGPQTECEALDRLVAGVRGGQSRVLVVRGEAGVGKTALLEHLAGARRRAAGSRARPASSPRWSSRSPACTRCAPRCSDHLGRLPAPQADALSTAFGLTAGPPPDRFLVGLAVLDAAGRRRRGAAAAVHRRRRAMARPGVGADARVRRAPAAGRAGRAGVRRCATAARSTTLGGLPDAGRARARRRRRPRAAGGDDPRAAGRARARSDPRRGGRQPARPAGAAARPDARDRGRRVRAARRADADEPHGAGLRAAAEAAAGRDPAPAAAGGGRAGRRRDAAVARGRAARHRARRGRRRPRPRA